MIAIQYFFLVLVFFPSVTFGVLSAEIFPWAIIFGLVAFRRIHKCDAWFTALLVVFLSLSTLWSFKSLGSDSVRSLAAYLNAILAFVTFMNLSHAWADRSIKLAKRILIFLLVLGIAQFANILLPLDGSLKLLVPRASGGSLSEMGGRGVTLLSSEPSRAGIELVFLYLLFRITNRSDIRFLLGDIAMIAYLIVIVKAAQPLAFGVFVIGLLIARSTKQTLFIGLMFLLCIMLLLTPLASFDVGGSRVLVLMEAASAKSSFSEAVFFVVNESGHRLLTIYAFVNSGLTHPLGLGVGMWQISSIQAIYETGIDITKLRYFVIHGGGDAVSVRGAGVLTNMMLDVGILGTGFFLYWIFRVTKRFRVRDMNTFVIMLILLVKISFFGSVGEPLPWVVTALILRYNATRNERPKSF